MNFEKRLDQSIAKWNLLESRFYKAWSEGCLPRESLAQYANEYGAFISRIPEGWANHGDDSIAEEERQHLELWRNFAQELGVDIGDPKTKEVVELVETADVLFSESATALGALYAFEAQQPCTADTKLAGLRQHYDVTEKACEYFVVHAQDYSEPDLLRSRIAALSDADRLRATAACEAMCQALRKALDGMTPAVISVQ
jgi:pyrroloquinoline-quinone synthase